MIGDDLNRVAEVQFEEPSGIPKGEAMTHLAHQIAKINHLNDRKADGFIDALRSERSDLIGLPFAMGDACRSKGEHSKQFADAVAMVRQALQSPGALNLPGREKGAGEGKGFSGAKPALAIPPNRNSASRADATNVNPPSPEKFWDQYQNLCTQQDKPQAQAQPERRETVILARIAALRQILMPMTEMHRGFVRYLSTIAHAEATKELARLAIFSGDDEVRKAALDALNIRRERDYTEILVQGFAIPGRPWPAAPPRPSSSWSAPISCRSSSAYWKKTIREVP